MLIVVKGFVAVVTTLFVVEIGDLICELTVVDCKDATLDIVLAAEGDVFADIVVLELDFVWGLIEDIVVDVFAEENVVDTGLLLVMTVLSVVVDVGTEDFTVVGVIIEEVVVIGLLVFIAIFPVELILETIGFIDELTVEMGVLEVVLTGSFVIIS